MLVGEPDAAWIAPTGDRLAQALGTIDLDQGR